MKQSGVDKVGSRHFIQAHHGNADAGSGADIRFIQQILGHSSISTTEIYTHVAIHKLKEIHRLTHPGSQRRTAAAVEDGELTEVEVFALLEAEREDE